MTHETHCNQGEYKDGCKYGEASDCPALKRVAGTSAASPQRALELAENIVRRRAEISATEPLLVGELMLNRFKRDLDDMEAICRHYAEIMQTETVAESYAHHSAEEIGYCKFYIAIDRGEQLIIKPKPPS